MPKNHEKVIMFPRWREVLEKESLEDVQAKKYVEALSKIDLLIEHEVSTYEIMIAKLVCLMELGQHEDAEDLCVNLLATENENYYHYAHIYLTILFQTDQHELLMERVEYELGDEHLQQDVRDQFQQLYDMSTHIQSDALFERSTTYIKALTVAIDEENHLKQWQLIESLRKMKLTPTDALIAYLVDERIHPVTKTVIFKWLQEKNVTDNVSIKKLNIHMEISPATVKKIRSHVMFKQTMLLINEIEQDNPTLFILLEQLLYRYMYVRYPMMPSSDDVIKIAEALKSIGQAYLHIETSTEPDESVVVFINEIKMCETLYLSIIEE